MNGLKGRIERIEKAKGLNVRLKYICITWDEEDREKGYEIQPCAQDFGGTEASPFICPLGRRSRPSASARMWT